MRRTIEELISRRKQHQQRVEELNSALEQLLARKFCWRRKTKIASLYGALNREFMDWVTCQDREWDAYAGNHAGMVFKSLQWKIEKLEAEYAKLHSLLASFATLENSLNRLIASFPEKIADASLQNQLTRVRDRLSVFQYADFERRFRGSEEELSGKLAFYLPYFADHDDILDIGCGRGEFLALLRDAGKKARGIDLSNSMLESALEKGLDCLEQDAIDHLGTSPEKSIGGIFAAQVIEHLEPYYLQNLILECLRVLKPGGVIILETLNPLSLFALSRIFYLDPGHRQPYHSEFMRYLLESAGFRSVEIVFPDASRSERLAEVDPELPGAAVFNANIDKLNDLIYSSSEYAVIGYKP